MDMTTSSASGQKVSRIELAKEIVEEFVGGDGDTLTGRPHDLIGLITFARYADTRSPLTFGHEALIQIVRNLEIQERPNEDGTAYGDALAIAKADFTHRDVMFANVDFFRGRQRAACDVRCRGAYPNSCVRLIFRSHDVLSFLIICILYW